MVKVSMGHRMPPIAYNVINGHNSRTVKVRLPKNEFKLSLEVLNVYIHMSLNLVRTNLS